MSNRMIYPYVVVMYILSVCVLAIDIRTDETDLHFRVVFNHLKTFNRFIISRFKIRQLTVMARTDKSVFYYFDDNLVLCDGKPHCAVL